MNTVVLVNPPNHRIDVYNSAPPLGLLCLAQVARECGFSPVIVDLDIPSTRSEADDPMTFYDYAADKILSYQPSLVGLTSMGLNAHVALLLAGRLKERDPTVRIATGGPFFSSIASAITTLSASVDFTISGEGEAGFKQLLNSISGSSAAHGDHAMVSHPFDAYDLINLSDYFSANPRCILNYESGRGCIFNCSFCYSPNHYERVRHIEPARLASDFQKLAQLGAKHIFVVNDNFINDPERANKHCLALADAEPMLTWNCYATLPQMTPKLANAMGNAGCNGVYFGVDAVSPAQQRAFKKRFFRTHADLTDKIRLLTDHGIAPTCAFILDLFNIVDSDVGAVFETAAHCANAGGRIRFNALARYPGTKLSASPRAPFYSEARAEIMLDCPQVVKRNDFAKLTPQYFPFHSSESRSEMEWRASLALIRAGQRLLQKYSGYFLDLKLSQEEWTKLFKSLVMNKQLMEEMAIA
jgi:radical SAM superfamily enzyme YgiQ (UPF0313 family)